MAVVHTSSSRAEAPHRDLAASKQLWASDSSCQLPDSLNSPFFLIFSQIFNRFGGSSKFLVKTPGFPVWGSTGFFY
jgi:hypothetical protein